LKIAAIAIALSSAVWTSSSTAAEPAYTLAKTVPLGAPDRWDYVTYDGQTDRVYVAHSDRLAVVDPTLGKVIGEVQGIAGGTHGSAVSMATHQGFTDDGEGGKAVAFDLHSLKVTQEIPAEIDADGIALDSATGHLFVVDGDSGALTVIDPKTNARVATIKAGEKLEFAAADGRSSVFVAGEANGDLIKVDVRSNRIAARWPTPDCNKPHGIAVDARSHRVFMGCVNSVMLVVNADNGRVVAKLLIGKGSDAVAFDPVRKRAFSSNGQDGTISAYQQRSADRYEALPVIHTMVSARTMAVDPKTGRLFVAGADTDPNPTRGGRSKVRPGTLRLLIFEPAQ
jgi:YVTN family beta-propeller protein